jgi:aminomethyltransferase
MTDKTPNNSSSKQTSANDDTTEASETEPLKTPFYDLHVQEGGRMVDFAGYLMPVQYELGIKQEHLYCREHVGLFDVSHMGQAELIAKDYETAARALETIVPGDVLRLKEGRMRYSVLLNEAGGIEDDLMITHRVQKDGSSIIGLVVNASRKSHDYDYINEQLAEHDVSVQPLDDRALLALQGPEAEKIISIWCGDAVGMPYMSEIETTFFDVPCRVARCGYTGEDGFEISMATADALRISTMLMSYPDMQLIGLGARDSLRLEAGFCLYGHDITAETSPIEADLAWIIGKRRRENGGFLGEGRILKELNEGPLTRRVGLMPKGASAPAREGAVLYDSDGNQIGIITSGGFGPTIGGPIAMGYVAQDFSQLGSLVLVEVRGKRYEWQVTDMPFTPYRTYKAKKPTTH